MQSNERTEGSVAPLPPKSDWAGEKVGAYALWFFLGMFGAHRFYVKKTGSAIAMLALCIGGWGIFIVGGGGLAYGIANEAVGTGVTGAAGLLVGGAAIVANGVWWLVDAILIALWKKVD